MAFRVELIRLILAHLSLLCSSDGPYHIKRTYKLHTLPQETYTVFRAVNAKGKVKEATIYKGAQGHANPAAALNLKEVKALIEKIKTHHGQNSNMGTSQNTQPEQKI